MLLYLKLIAIPITAGIVGYATNALAIRMLFRPFKAHWYTLGWQGIIPRTRNELAKNVGSVVAEKLVTHEEIDKNLSNPELFDKIKLSIIDMVTSATSERDVMTDQFNKIFNIVIDQSLKNSLSNPEISKSVNTIVANVAKEAVKIVLSMPRKELAKKLAPLSDMQSSEYLHELISFTITKSIKENVHNVILSGKSIQNLLPITIEVEPLSANITTNHINPALINIFNNKDVAIAISQWLIEYKDTLFYQGGLSDKLKIGMINTFFNSTRIKELSIEKLPEIGVYLTTNLKMQTFIQETVIEKIDEILNTPLSKLIDNLGDERYYALLYETPRQLVQRAMPDNLVSYILNILAGDDSSNETLLELLEKSGTDISTIMPQDIDVSRLIISDGLLRWIRSHLRGRVKNLTLTQTQVDNLSTLASTWLIGTLRGVLPRFLKLINLHKLVEEKILSLELKEVEDMLFSFMKEHFIWINLLGFIIGFLMGVAQVAMLVLAK